MVWARSVSCEWAIESEGNDVVVVVGCAAERKERLTDLWRFFVGPWRQMADGRWQVRWVALDSCAAVYAVRRDACGRRHSLTRSRLPHRTVFLSANSFTGCCLIAPNESNH